jgi:hypothetical protein
MAQTPSLDDDAQRALEQRSLRNVRSLLDKLEHEAESEKRTRRVIGWALAIALVVVFGGFLAYLQLRDDHPKREVVITPRTP